MSVEPRKGEREREREREGKRRRRKERDLERVSVFFVGLIVIPTYETLKHL